METLTIQEAMARLGITRASLYRLVKQKKLRILHHEQFKFPYLLRAEVEAYRRSDRKPGPKPKTSGTVSPNSYEPINDDDLTSYDFND